MCVCVTCWCTGKVLTSKWLSPYDGKVFSLNWAPSQSVYGDRGGGELLFSCGPDGRIVCPVHMCIVSWCVHMCIVSWCVCMCVTLQICWEVWLNPLDAVRLVSLILPMSKHRWLTTVSILSHPRHSRLVLCGDRKGSLHLYRLNASDLECCGPYQTLPWLHGPNGVTYSCVHQQVIYTCGRDGLCRKFVLGEDGEMVELTRFKVRWSVV